SKSSIMTIVDENYIPQNKQDLYDAILNTLFPILLIKFLDLSWNKNEKKMKRTFDKRKENDAKIIDAVQGIRKAANEDVLKDEYEKSLNISEANKLILKRELIKLIPNTIEDGDDDEELANLEIELKRCKKEISDNEEILDKKEILDVLDEILKEIEEEREEYFKISRVSTFRAIALPLFDDALYNIVTWTIPLIVAFAYDDLL
ncbi:9638_t:CDS:2, partial [Racocetra fulgida]